MAISADMVMQALEADGLTSRVWAKGGETRVYLRLDSAATRAALGLTSSEARQMDRGNAPYVEVRADDALVQYLTGAREATVLAALSRAGIHAR